MYISFLSLPFPPWAYAWRWCRCCHLLVALPVRYLASGMWWIGWKTWKNRVQVKRRKFGPRPRSTLFFKSDGEMLQSSSMSLYKDLTSRFFFWKAFGQIQDYLRNLDLLGLNIFGGKKNGESPRRSGIGMDTQNMCATFYGLSLKKFPGHLGFLCGRHVYFA